MTVEEANTWGKTSPSLTFIAKRVKVVSSKNQPRTQMIAVVLIAAVVLVIAVLYLRGAKSLPTTALDEIDADSPEDAIERTSSDGSAVHCAIVLLSGDPALSLTKIAGVMMKRWSDLGLIDPVFGTEGLRRSLKVGDATVSFELCGRFKHSRTLEARLDRNYVWPEAAALVGSYVGTVLVEVEFDEDRDCSGSLDYSILLTQAVYGLVKSCPSAAGVYWPAAGHILSRSQVVKGFNLDLQTQLPLKSWVGVWAYHDEQGRVVGFTQGLPLIGGDDFEVIDAPENVEEVRGRLYGLIDYAASRGWVLRNGDTIGVDEVEKIAVHKQPSELGRSGWVMQLSYRQESPHKPWQR